MITAMPQDHALETIIRKLRHRRRLLLRLDHRNRRLLAFLLVSRYVIPQ
jgi:hypothetical protein